MDEAVSLGAYDGVYGVWPLSADHPLDALEWFDTEEQARAWLAEHGYTQMPDLPNYYERASNGVS